MNGKLKLIFSILLVFIVWYKKIDIVGFMNDMQFMMTNAYLHRLLDELINLA